MSFGEMLRDLRRTTGLTQEELAERAGLTVNGISALERGTRTRPYPHTLRALADGLRLEGERRAAFLAAAARALPDATVERAEREAPSGLAAPPTALIGRDDELRRLCDLLADRSVRLITLTGPGGVGKTRLAVEASRRMSGTFPAGTHVVDLAAVTDARLVASVVDALVPHAPRGAGADPAARRLAVLDNFEHLLDEAPLVADMVARSPGLTVLVTSRARLRLRGETAVDVPPLVLPGRDARLSVDDVAATSTVMLFVDRARSVDPAFAVTQGNASQIAAICRRLGGLPLAVELAAAKVRTLAPADLLEHLDDALATGWARDLPARQHTLRSALDWGYRLLDPPARELLLRLSVFVGGFTLDAVRAVWDRDGSPVAALETLVEHSFVVGPAQREHAYARSGVLEQYRLLEPVRQYAAALLAETGQAPDVRDRHATYFLDYAEGAAQQYHSRDRVLWLERTDSECDNLRAAMEWVLRAGDADRAARLGWALWLPWWSRGQFAEGRLRMESALRLEISPRWRWRALIVLASFCDVQQDADTARTCWEEALKITQAGGDPVGEAWGLAGLGMAAMTTAPREAQDLLTRVLPLADKGGETWLHALCSMWLGALHVRARDPQAARTVIEPALRSARQREDRMITSIGVVNLAQALLLEGRDGDAERLLCECVELCVAMHTHVNMEVSLGLLAVIAAGAGQWERAVTLQAAAEHMGELLGAGAHETFLVDGSRSARAHAAARQALEPARYTRAVQAGQAMSLESAARFVLDGALVRHET